MSQSPAQQPQSGAAPGAGAQFVSDPAAQLQAMLKAPLPRAREDLVISPQLYLGHTVHVVKDPVSLTYFRLDAAEYFIFRRLNGDYSAEQLSAEAEKKFPDRNISPEDVLRFAHMLQAAGLMHGRGEQHGSRLREMKRVRRRKRRNAQLINIMFIRVPIIDPDRLLDWLYRFAGSLMNRWTMWLAIAFMAITGLAAIGSLWRIGDLKFPVLSWTNLMLLSATFFLIKIIHEFGHGLAAKHRRLEVHEMGILFMVFLPMYYVDVSDAWILPRKSERLWINAGGVFIEFFFASIAVWVWLYSEPGWVNQIAFNTMLAASITTLLFNANPLLKYDGYYFLMDWMEIPNLRTKASQYVGYLFKRFVLGMKDIMPPAEAQQRPVFMVVYAVTSTIYRWIVVAGIVSLVWHLLDPYGLQAIGTLLGTFAFLTMFVLPVFNGLRGIWKLRAKVERRVSVSLAGLAVIVLGAVGVLSIPVEYAVERPVVVMAQSRQPVFAPISGRIDEILCDPTQVLEAGQPILRLDDEGLITQRDVLNVRHQQALLELNVARAKDNVGDVEQAIHKVGEMKERLDYANERVEQLIIRAPITGRLYTPKRLHRLVGVRVEPGNLIGTMIGDGPVQFVTVLPQDEAARITEGMPARVRLWPTSHYTYHGAVARVGRQFIKSLPHDALASVYGGEVDTAVDQRNNVSPSVPSVLAAIELQDPAVAFDPEAPALIDGMTGRGIIVLGRSTFGRQQWRLIQRTISLDWWL